MPLQALSFHFLNTFFLDYSAGYITVVYSYLLESLNRDPHVSLYVNYTLVEKDFMIPVQMRRKGITVTKIQV